MSGSSAIFESDIVALCTELSLPGRDFASANFMKDDPAREIIAQIFENINNDRYLPCGVGQNRPEVVKHWQGFANVWHQIKFIGVQEYDSVRTENRELIEKRKLSAKSTAIWSTVLFVVSIGIAMLWLHFFAPGFPVLPTTLATGSVSIVFIPLILRALWQYKQADKGVLPELEQQYILTMRGFIEKFLDIMASNDQAVSNGQELNQRQSRKRYRLGEFFIKQDKFTILQRQDFGLFPDLQIFHVCLPAFYEGTFWGSSKKLFADAQKSCLRECKRLANANKRQGLAGFCLS